MSISVLLITVVQDCIFYGTFVAYSEYEHCQEFYDDSEIGKQGGYYEQYWQYSKQCFAGFQHKPADNSK